MLGHADDSLQRNHNHRLTELSRHFLSLFLFVLLRDHMRTYNKIMVGKVHYGSHLSPQAIDLISKLLADKPSKRLGVIAGGATLIKQHPWFKGFDWAAFEAKQMVAPIPVVNKLAGLSHDDKSMLSNFDPQQDDKKQFPLYVPDPKKPDWDKHF